MTILSVDDSTTMRKIINLALKTQGHTVLEAENGKQALEVLASQRVDAVVLDINMPIMNGIEFLIEFNKSLGTSKIPVIVLTTQGEEVLKKEAFALGAKAFLVKPFQKEELVATLATVTT